METTHEGTEFRGNPKSVSALEHARGVLSANHRAGLVIDRRHMSTVMQKLLDEQELPRIRVLQLLNKLTDAVNSGATTITLTVDELRLLIQTPDVR